MNIVDLLTPRRVVCIDSADNKEHLLELLGGLLAIDQSTVTAQEITEGLSERERLGSTYLERGIALPHDRPDQGTRIIGAFIRLKHEVNFDALDEQPVDLVFGLLVPKQLANQYLVILADLMEMFRDEAFCQQLRQADTDRALFERLTQWQPVPT